MTPNTQTPQTPRPITRDATAPGPTPELVREFLRLRAVARQKKDEASRQALLAFAVEHQIGGGAGTILD